jgi:transcriptional regulator with XRE-family HTH domain
VRLARITPPPEVGIGLRDRSSAIERTSLPKAYYLHGECSGCQGNQPYGGPPIPPYITSERPQGLRIHEAKYSNGLPPSVDLSPTAATDIGNVVDSRRVGGTPWQGRGSKTSEVAMLVGESMPEKLAKEIGIVLRVARRARGLTLRNASILSSGIFKPSSLASYERGDRALSVERFLLLADLYGIRPSRLIAQISRRVEERPPIVVAVRAAHTIGGVEGAILAGFVREVVALRQQPARETISLRDGDLEVLATAAGRRVEDFMQAVEPALRQA